MKKIINKSFIVLALFFGLVFLLNISGMLKLYTNGTPANEPGLSYHSKILVSNLVTYKMGDFISDKHNDPLNNQQFRTHRICGMPLDTIQIINGDLWVNHKPFDSYLNLKHAYRLAENQFKTITDAEKKDLGFETVGASKIIVIYLSTLDATHKNMTDSRQIKPEIEVDSEINKIYKKPWNKDYFGPIIIPENKVFVLGDHREQSEDSRFLGLIDDSEIVGTIIYPRKNHKKTN